jgi:hypothetical protein
VPSRVSPVRSQPGFSLPFFDRLAPPPPPGLIAARIDAATGPGDVVLDLAGRGGWVARAAVDRQRRAVSLESSPLTRLLAELVLRPPDLRHLDAAFQAMSASPHGQTSLKNAIGELYTTRCATCGRSLTVDEVVWNGEESEGIPATARKQYACPICRGTRGGVQRSADIDEDDLVRARAIPEGYGAIRARLRDRFPPVEGAVGLVDALLDLHTPRQLAGLAAILDRIELDLRAAPVEAALRLAFLHALLPASRLNGYPSRIGNVRIQGGRVKPPPAGQWRERNPWLAFEDGIRTVRGFIQRLESGPGGAVQARLGEDLRSLADGTATAVLRIAGPSTTRAIGEEAALGGGWETAPGLRRRIRLVLGQPPVRPNQERLSLIYWASSWTLGSEAASALPLAALAGGAVRAPWGWQAAALARSLGSIEPSVARDGRVVYLVDGSAPEPAIATSLGAVAAGFRLVTARLGDGDDDAGGVVELVPPGAVMPPPARTRANVMLDALPGGAGDPDVVPGSGLFGAPERIDRRPFSTSEVARTVADVAVETIKARGEPASRERLLGQILVGLDRAGQLRRLVAEDTTDAQDADARKDPGTDAEPSGADDRSSPSGRGSDGGDGPSVRVRRTTRPADAPVDQVERLLAIIDSALAAGGRRLHEIEPGRWWLADPADRAAAAAPLADRVEWAVFSLLSTAGPLSEAAFLQRIAALFAGPDLPDEHLVRACLESYRGRASTPDRLVTADDLLRRAQEHAELIALLADGGHRLGLSVWIGRREQARRVGANRLGDWLDEREHRAYLHQISRAVDEVGEVDCIWYARGRMAFLFEIEWTAMLGEPVLRRHAKIPQDDGLVRFLVVAPERTELVRHKLERSPLLREAFERDNWHVLKWHHLRSFLARETLSLDALEPFVGLDPAAERSGEQMGLFGES